MSVMTERVTHVHHNLFSFRTTRDPGYRFKNGHFTMIGLPSGERPLMRAYSITSSNYEPELEFFSIKVQDGALTSKLQNLKVGDKVMSGKNIEIKSISQLSRIPLPLPFLPFHDLTYGLLLYLSNLSGECNQA